MSALQVVASTSNDSSDSVLSFQYTWPLRVSSRLIENSEAVVLNVSPPFSTSYNGVQFTWALRLSDECVVCSNVDAPPTVRQVYVLLYFKDGPCSDVTVEEIRAWVVSDEGETVMNDMRLGCKEFTRGSGWPVPMTKNQGSFTEFIQQRIDTQLSIVVDIRMKATLFEPFIYLPDVNSASRSKRIEKTCEKFVADILNRSVDIPNLDLLESQDDKFAIHRLVFLCGCDLVERECLGDNEEHSNSNEHSLNAIRNNFAHVYFEKVLMKEVEYFDDFVVLLEGVIAAHIPPLKREIERFICREVMAESTSRDLDFTKKMLLLAERYSLEVLKMVATGVLVDQILAHSNPPRQLVHISHELKQFANEMNRITSIDLDDSATSIEETLVGSVVEDLQSLTRRVRRVSLSHSPSMSSQSSSPSITPISALSPAVSEQRPFDSPTQSRFKRVELA